MACVWMSTCVGSGGRKEECKPVAAEGQLLHGFECVLILFQSQFCCRIFIVFYNHVEVIPLFV